MYTHVGMYTFVCECESVCINKCVYIYIYYSHRKISGNGVRHQSD
jgi:hypothetical protein